MCQLNRSFFPLTAALFAVLLDLSGVGGEAAALSIGPSGTATRRTFSHTSVIPIDEEVSAFQFKGETKQYLFLNVRKVNFISLIVTPCTSSIHAVLRFRDQNGTVNGEKFGKSANSLEPPLREYEGRESHTFSLRDAPSGLYVLQVTPLLRESYITLYASLEPNGPHVLRLRQNPNIRLLQHHKQRLQVKWDASSVDPYSIEYCLVVNTRRLYTSLCEARGERYGVIPPEPPNFSHQTDSHKTSLAIKAARDDFNRLGRKTGVHEDILIRCVGSKTQYSLEEVQQGKVYHINVFAVNSQTNLSFPYGNKTIKFHGPRTESLKDGKPSNVALRQMNGRASFKFKVGAKAIHGLQMYVMPCGGAVDVEVVRLRTTVLSRTRAEGYKRFAFNETQPGERYTIRVTSPSPEELFRINSVEVFVTTRPLSKFPLPTLPSDTGLMMYKTRCSSAIIGWIPSPDPDVSEYFVYVMENTKTDWEFLQRPNQCELDRRLKSSKFVFRVLQVRKDGDKSRVMTQEVRNLRPRTRYTIRVVVKKPLGKSLSYDLLQVLTLSRCIKSTA